MINIPSKSQIWSIDIILGVILFMAAFLIFLLLLNSNENSRALQLKKEAAIVARQLTAEDSVMAVINDSEVSDSKMDILKNMDYKELKRKFRIEGDFCIFLEDDEGNIVLINQNYKGIGSPAISIDGTPCSQ